MPFAWELPDAGLPAVRAAAKLRSTPAFDPFNLTPDTGLPFDPEAPEPLPPAKDEAPEDEPGFFTKWLLEPLGRPGSALKAALAGEGGKALKALTPFGESMGVYDPDEDYVSGQELLKSWGVIDQADNPLFSGAGAAGLAADFVLDPLNLIGVGAATKAGKALNMTRGALKEAGAVNKALRAGQTLDDLGQAGRAVDLTSNVANAGRRAVQAAREGGQTLDDILKPAGTVAEQGARGERALVAVADNFDPLGLLRMGGRYNPVNWLPEVPGVTAPLPLPESIAGLPLIQGQPVLNAASKAAEVIGKTAPFRQIGQLFSKAPPGVEGEAAQAFWEARDNAAKARQAGEAEAAEVSGLLGQRLRDPELLTEKRVRRVGDDLVDVLTGDVLREGTPGLDAEFGLSPEMDAYTAMPFGRYEAPKTTVDLPPEGARVRGLGDVAESADVQVGRRVQTERGQGKVVEIDGPTATVRYRGGVQVETPLGELKPVVSGREQEEARLVQEFGASGKKELEARAFDTRKALGQGLGLESVARQEHQLTKTGATSSLIEDLLTGTGFENAGKPQGLTRAANQTLQDMIDSEIMRLGYAADKASQAKALPKVLEHTLKKTGELPQGFKTIETISADAAELMPGDSFTLGGEKFTFKGTTDEGLLRLKDHVEIEVPSELVPKDKGSAIERAGFDPLTLEAVPSRAGQAAGRMTEQEITNILGAAENRELPLELQQHLGALQGEMRASSLPPSFDPLEEIARPAARTAPVPDAPRVATEPPPPVAPSDAQARGQQMVNEVALERAGRIEKGSAAAEQFQRLKRLEANERKLAGIVADMEAKGVPVNSPQFQAAIKERQAMSVERFGLENEIRTGQPSPIGPRPTPAAVERETFKRQVEPAIREHARIRKYLANAGYGTQEAAIESARLLPEGTSPAVGKAIGDALEVNRAAPGEAANIADALRAEYDDMFEAEQAWAVQTPGLKDPRLTGYAPHIPTAQGRGYFKRLAKAPEQRVALFKALQEQRAANGVQNLAEGGMAEELAGGIKRMGQKTDAKEIAIPHYMKGEAEARLAALDPQTRDWLEQHGLEREFLTWDKLAQNTHESQIARLAQYKGLTINELNDVFKAHGAKADVFSADPAVQLFVRKKRHAAAKAANQLFDELSGKLGIELDPSVNAVSTMDPEILNYQGKGYGLASINQKLVEAGRSPVVFPDMATAKGVQQSINKLLNPEEAGPLLEWYDKATQLFKSYVTRGFPAFHVRNHISNTLQSFLEDVPVSGQHNTLAHKLLAGQDFKVRLGDGSEATRDMLRHEMQQQGVLQSGYFEKEFGGAIEQSLHGQPTWNPLDPNNKFIRGAERVSAGVAMLPGQVASTGGVGVALKADGRMLESADRARHYIAKRMQGFSPDEAAASVKKALFDYADMNDFEKNVMGRAVFFYGYQRNILPLVLNKMLEKPGAVHQMLELSAGGQGPDQQGLPAHLPSFAREGLPSSLGRDAEGNPMVLWGVENPVTAGLQPLAGFSEGPQRGAEKLLSQANPLLRMPLELATNRRFFLGKDIDEANKAPHYTEDLPANLQELLGVRKATTAGGGTRYTMDPYALYALENSPLGRLSGTASKLTDDKKGLGAELVNFLTGAKITSVDEEKEAYYAKKNASMRRLRELERQGLVTERQLPIFTANDVGKDNPEVKAALKASREKRKP